MWKTIRKKEIILMESSTERRKEGEFSKNVV